jgi:hypothetical protein
MTNTSDASGIYRQTSSAPAACNSTSDSRGINHQTSADASGSRGLLSNLKAEMNRVEIPKKR